MVNRIEFNVSQARDHVELGVVDTRKAKEHQSAARRVGFS
jgi:hypothetical protein